MNNTKSILEAQHYVVSLTGGNLIIDRKNSDQLFIGLSLFFGFLFTALAFLHISFLLFTLVAVAIPWFNRKWQYPKSIQFNKSGYVQLAKSTILGRNEKVPLSTLEELQIGKIIKTADTSPFKEGNLDFYYNVLLKTTSGTKKLMRLQFRKEADAEIDEIRDFLRKYIQSIKT